MSQPISFSPHSPNIMSYYVVFHPRSRATPTGGLIKSQLTYGGEELSLAPQHPCGVCTDNTISAAASPVGFARFHQSVMRCGSLQASEDALSG